MGKFQKLRASVMSAFGSAEWTAENIVTTVDNYNSTITQPNYIRISVIPSANGRDAQSVSGIVIAELYTKAGESSKKLFEMADVLDDHLVGKSFGHPDGSSLQFFGSTLSKGKIDSENSSLYRSDYHINFKFFGVKR